MNNRRVIMEDLISLVSDEVTTSTTWYPTVANDSFDENNEFNNTTAFNTGNRTTRREYPMALIVLDWFNLYYLGFIVVVGVLGNAKNVFVFVRKKKELRSPTYYLAALALADVIFLAILFILWLNHFDIDLFSQSFIYKLLLYISSLSSCMSAWLIAAFTFERLIIVRYPLRRSNICTVRRAKCIIGCLTVAVAIVQIVSLFTTGITDDNNTKREMRYAANSTDSMRPAISRKRNSNSFLSFNQVMRIINMLETFVTLVVPPLLIVVMNSMIVHCLIQFARTFQDGSLNKNRSRSGSIANPHQIQVNIQLHTMRVTSETTRSESPNHQRLSNNNEANKHHHNCNSRRINCHSSNSGHVAKYTNTMAVLQEERITDLTTAVRTTRTSVVSTTAADNIQTDVQRTSCHGNGDSSNRTADEIHLDMDAIESYPENNPSSITEDAETNNSESAAALAAIDRLQQQPHQHLIINHAEGEQQQRRPCVSSNRTEYIITKKLVIISTVHIFLNLPSYIMGLKIFIDDWTKQNMSVTTWTLHQYSLLLYYTNFAINFLLYSTSSDTFRNQLFCCCKKEPQQQQDAAV